MRSTIALILCFIALTLPSHAQTVAEQYLFLLTNQHRAEHNLAPLTWSADLARAAQAHAQRILEQPGTLEHQYLGEPDLITRAANSGAHFSAVSENIAGNAQTPSDIDQSWMLSPTHRANILDPNLNAVGIAVVGRRGFLIAVQDFARWTPNLSHDDIEQTILSLLTNRGFQAAPSAAQAQARATCVMSSGNAGHPSFVVLWDGADIQQIPAIILKQVPTAAAHPVAIGACPSRSDGHGFTTYRVAILLY